MTTLDASFKFVSSFVKIRPVTTDSALFKLHYRFTTPLILVLCVLVWCKQFFGEPIRCEGSGIDQELLDSYCWIHSTYTVPGSKDGAYPGVDKATDDDPIEYHAYYQWVFLFLLFQAACFFIPYYLWVSAEGGKLENLLFDLNKPVVVDECARQKSIKIVARYLYNTLGQHRTYLCFYYLCETLNLTNAILQIYLTDVFLAGEFTTYGLDVIRFSMGMHQRNRTDPMIRVFPRMTKCTFYRYGLSGDEQKHDALCVLSVNIFNDKIFVFLWFWFIILALLDSVVIISRVFLLIFKKLRFRVTFSNNRFVDRNELERVVIRSDFGSWFLLNLLSRNITTMNFVELIHNYTSLMDESLLTCDQELVGKRVMIA